MTPEESRREWLHILRALRERAVLEGDWAWFEVYDQRIRDEVENGENDHG